MGDRSLRRAGVLKYDQAAGERVDDRLAAEEPLEIRVNGAPLTVVMRTPGQERDHVLGFLFGEGIIRAAADIEQMAVLPNGEHPDLENVIDVRLRPSAPGRSEEHTSELQSRFDLVCRLLLEKKK